MDNAQYWLTENPDVFLIGGRKFNLVKKGREQAKQIAEFNQWLRKYIAPVAESFRGMSQADAGIGLGALLNMAGALDEEGQIALAKAVLGSTDVNGQPLPAEFFDEYYDIAWVADATKHVSRVSAVMNLITSFFTSAA